MKDRVLRRFSALCAAFVMLFSSVPVSTAADEAGSTAPACGLEEHRHTDACREDVLVCGMEESAPRTEKRFFSNFKKYAA